MVKLQLKHAPFSWPFRCAACGAPAIKHARASCSILAGGSYHVFFIRTEHRVISFRYPVCSRHYIIASIAGPLSKRSMKNLAVGVLWAIIALATVSALFASGTDSLFRGDYLHASKSFLGALAIAISGPFIYLILRSLTPVKLHSATDDTITLSMTNTDYAEDFKRLNQSVLLRTLRFWEN